MTPRNRRRLGVLVGIALFLPLVVASPAPGDPLDDKKAEAARIQDQLEKHGARTSVLTERFNQVRLKVAETEGALTRAQADLGRSDERMKLVRGRLATAAVLAYVHGGSNALLSQLARGGNQEMVIRRQYLRVASADQCRVIGELRAAREDQAAVRARLEAEQRSARKAAEEADGARKSAAEAEAAQRLLLGRVKGELTDLVAAEQARREAAQAQEQARRRAVETAPPALAAPAARVAEVATTRPTTPPIVASRVLAPPAPASGKGAVAVAEARKHLGKPYRWGGSGPDSFDCSGLTAYAWRAAGVSLSHSAYTQWFETTRVPTTQVVPGDLLFFGSSVEGIHHNAIYIGDGQMIEASQTGTPIRIRGWRAGDLVGAGRPG